MIQIKHIALSLLSIASLQAQEWKSFPVPAEAGEGKEWSLLKKFSSEFSNDGKDYKFAQNWDDYYMHPWIGPGLTNFRSDDTTITGGKLVLKASRQRDGKLVNCGIISSKEAVKYPVFMEASIKVSGLVLSSNFWLLSLDSKQELDIIECYGGSKDSEFETKMKTNYHIFERSADGEEIKKDHSSKGDHTLADKAPLRNDYHRIGAYWKVPYHVDFFLNGKLVRSMTKEDFKSSTDAGFKGLEKPMHIIFDLEDHGWRSEKGYTPTDEQLADESLNKMFVDWIRVYKPK